MQKNGKEDGARSAELAGSGAQYLFRMQKNGKEEEVRSAELAGSGAQPAGAQRLKTVDEE